MALETKQTLDLTTPSNQQKWKLAQFFYNISCTIQLNSFSRNMQHKTNSILYFDDPMSIFLPAQEILFEQLSITIQSNDQE